LADSRDFFFPKMARKRMEAAKLTRLEARTRVIQGAGKLALIACCLSLGFVVVATAFPQRRALEKLEARLTLAKEQERQVIAERDQRRIELRALREDPAYLEIHARDRLDYCRDGEKIFRFRRDR
jgi:cell division protein FtsB